MLLLLSLSAIMSSYSFQRAAESSPPIQPRVAVDYDPIGEGASDGLINEIALMQGQQLITDTQTVKKGSHHAIDRS